MTNTTSSTLDPWQVKVGDTVTVSVATTDVAGTFSVTGTVYRHTPYGPAFVGGHALAAAHTTLTDHQPAPELEPVDERIYAWERVARHPVFSSAYDGDGPLIDSVMGVLDRLAHQPEPASEPEPEWKPGTVVQIKSEAGEVTATMVRVRDAWVNVDNGLSTEWLPAGPDVSRLVVIDRQEFRTNLRDALRETENARAKAVAWYEEADLILAELRIEAIS